MKGHFIHSTVSPLVLPWVIPLACRWLSTAFIHFELYTFSANNILIFLTLKQDHMWITHVSGATIAAVFCLAFFDLGDVRVRGTLAAVR
jgi:hypothetical protein